jgi:fibronectin-binding autotransporter adhesin
MRNYVKRNYLSTAAILFAMCFHFCVALESHAAITPIGDVEPVGTWDSSTISYVGNTSDGSFLVDAGSILQSRYAYFGWNQGVTGTATVTGAGSMWTNTYSIFVGVNGTGALRIEAGGQVSNSGGYLGYYSGSSGTAMVTGIGSAWTNSDNLYVGYSGTGTIRIEAGGQVNSSNCYLGSNNSLSSGNVTVTGTGSTWTNSKFLMIGNNGAGVLRIETGGHVNSSNCYLGSNNSHFSSNVTVTGTDSTWTNSGSLYVIGEGIGVLTVTDGGAVTAGTLYASLSSLSGNGTITATQGAILDADLRFDTAHPSQQTVAFGSGGILTVNAVGGELGAGYKGNGSLTIAEGVTINSAIGYIGFNSGSSGTAKVTGTGSKWINNNYLYIGGAGAGTLRIESGGQVSNSYGYLGDNPGSSGTVTVTGASSKWTNNNYLYIGNSGKGTLRIEAGGQVSNYNDGYLGYNPDSSGVATVTGVGSKWTNNGILYIGHSYGIGTLHIRDGGVVSASSVYVNDYCLLTIDVGYGSNLRIGSSGTGSISNSGCIRLLAGPQQAAGTQYKSITDDFWSSGTIQSVGGTWDYTSQIFTVSQALAGVSGTRVSIDLARQQRVSVTEAGRNWSVVASFLAKTGTGNGFDFTAMAISDADLTALSGLIDPGQSVLSGWNLTAVGSGYNASDPVYVSLGIPLSLSHGNVQLWRLSGKSWSRFNVDDLTVNDGYASFTSTGLSGYAISAVPEPGMAVLLVCGLMGAIGWRWRKR